MSNGLSHLVKTIVGTCSVEDPHMEEVDHNGGKGSITQWVHAEYMEGSETIHPTFTHWVRDGYFLKVPTKVPTG